MSRHRLLSFLRTGNNRGEAKAVLIALLCFVLALALLQGSAFLINGPQAFSQASPSPSPTGPTIQFLNPAKLPGQQTQELSTKNDGTNTTYHLVAWVSAVPTSPTVEFKYQSSTPNTPEISIAATQVGADTFEANWDMAGAGPEAMDASGATPTEGTSGTLRAILYSGGNEISRDNETVRINQQAGQTPPACPSSGNETCEEEDQANTVELTYPTSGGGLGWYRPNPGQGPINSVFDVTSSAGTETIRSFYTLSRPGVEPEWKACAPASETKANSADGVRCEYAAADNPANVTAVAVRADDMLPRLGGATSEADQDTSDAHRVLPYEQQANSVLLTNGQQTVDPNKCTAVITATVLDQASPPRKIADTNVDVHAAATVDELFFDDSAGTYSAANKPPENHPTEPAAACETANNPPNQGTQGEHEIAGPGDTKHIESLNDTDDAGQWKFALLARVTATAQFVVWADEDSNDRLCSSEAQANGSAGWGSAMPSPSGFSPEDTVCPRPQPTGSPTPTQSPTRSPTPTASPSSPAPTEPRTLTLATSRSRTKFGQRVSLAGQILADDEDCENGEFVRIRRRIHGKRSSVEFKTATSDANGRYETDIIARRNADYRALVSAHDNCGDAQSSPVTIQVKVKVKITASDRTPRRGSRVRLKVTVKPSHVRTKVVLQRKKGRRFVKVDTARLGRRGVIFNVPANFKARVFRAKWRGQDRDHEGNNSKTVKVKTHR